MNFFFTTLILTLFSLTIFCQTPSRTILTNTIQTIQTQQKNFHIPVVDSTIWVGEIDLRYIYPIIHYKVKTYEGGSHLAGGEGSWNSKLGRPSSPEYVPPRRISDIGGDIQLINAKRVNLRFTVVNWAPSDNTFGIRLGNLNPVSINKGESEIIFRNVVAPNISSQYLQLSFIVNGQPLNAFGNPNAFVSHVEALRVGLHTFATGVITVPVLPTSLIYAPPADLHKLNTVSIDVEDSYTQTLTTTFGIFHSSTTSVTNTPLDAIVSDMNLARTVLSAIPDPDAQAAGQALAVISPVLSIASGSKKTTTTTGGQTSESNSNTQIDKVGISTTIGCQVGGSGEGDAVYYRKNAKFIWMINDGKVVVSYLGCDRVDSRTMKELADAYKFLKDKPLGTIDTAKSLNLDSLAIGTLLRLDPFAGPYGRHTVPDPKRFTLIIPDGNDGNPYLHSNAAERTTYSFTHTIASSELSSNAIITSQAVVDNPGFLSVLGLGITDNNSFQTVITKSATTQYNSGQSVTKQFTFNAGNGVDNYWSEVYYDNVFGTYAFREPLKSEIDGSNIITAIVYDDKNKVLPATKVILWAADKIIAETISDEQGKVRFLLPNEYKKTDLSLKTNTSILKIDFNKQIKSLKLNAKKENI